MFSGDFLKLTAASVAYDEDEWSDQEVLLLLEAIEMFDDDWAQIEEHVKTRTAHQCIKKFLDLPIEEPYVVAESESVMGPLRYGRLPFEQADNPIMTVVAFLAGVVKDGPGLDTAKKALDELAKDEAKALEEHGAKDSQAGTSGDEPTMEVDKTKAETTKSPNLTTENGTAEGDISMTSSAADEKDPSTVKAAIQEKKSAIPDSRIVRAADSALKSISKAATHLASAEDTKVRSSLASLVKLTMTKLELKMAQFEELEELVEEERNRLESAKKGLIAERLGVRTALDEIRAEVARNEYAAALAVGQADGIMGTTGQGPRVNEVDSFGDKGPIEGASFSQLT
jgi:SWI/SNF related-matrix-associated actin-dependent regulator of chromatin subfamily C